MLFMRHISTAGVDWSASQVEGTEQREQYTYHKTNNKICWVDDVLNLKRKEKRWNFDSDLKHSNVGAGLIWQDRGQGWISFRLMSSFRQIQEELIRNNSK